MVFHITSIINPILLYLCLLGQIILIYDIILREALTQAVIMLVIIVIPQIWLPFPFNYLLRSSFGHHWLYESCRTLSKIPVINFAVCLGPFRLGMKNRAGDSAEHNESDIYYLQNFVMLVLCLTMVMPLCVMDIVLYLGDSQFHDQTGFMMYCIPIVIITELVTVMWGLVICGVNSICAWCCTSGYIRV
eukprot:TRINITY_DN6475_c0_g1_i1.p1 TRINITY_DN6475_c0_g1~~TRINITY_DN6475_c0_g1_i1.p1  ORF type:complete len:189 (+),score=7.48 TRINITY_DN6475_c0_g1_i1:178-744(+)